MERCNRPSNPRASGRPYAGRRKFYNACLAWMIYVVVASVAMLLDEKVWSAGIGVADAAPVAKTSVVGGHAGRLMHRGTGSGRSGVSEAGIGSESFRQAPKDVKSKKHKAPAEEDGIMLDREERNAHDFDDKNIEAQDDDSENLAIDALHIGKAMENENIERESLEALMTVLEAQVQPFMARTKLLQSQLDSIQEELERVRNSSEDRSRDLNAQSSRMAVAANAVTTLHDQLNETLRNLEETVEFNGKVRDVLEREGFELWINRHLKKRVSRSALALIRKSKTVMEKYAASELNFMRKTAGPSSKIARYDPFFRVMLQASFIVAQLVVMSGVLVRVLPLPLLAGQAGSSFSNNRVQVQTFKLYGLIWFALQSFACLLGSIFVRCDILSLWFELHPTLFFLFLVILAPSYIVFFVTCVLSALRESRRLNGALQSIAVLLIGVHFYQGVWIRAILDMQPTIDSSAYVIYLALLGLITRDHCHTLRLDPRKLVQEAQSLFHMLSCSDEDIKKGAVSNETDFQESFSIGTGTGVKQKTRRSKIAEGGKQ